MRWICLLCITLSFLPADAVELPDGTAVAVTETKILDLPSPFEAYVSPDGRQFMLQVNDGGDKYHFWYHGVQSPTYNGGPDVDSSPGGQHFLYTVVQKDHVEYYRGVDATPLPKSVFNVCYSPGDKRVAYINHLKDGQSVTIDGVDGPVYPEVENVWWSRTGAHYRYRYYSVNGQRLIIDGQEWMNGAVPLGRWEAFTPDEKHLLVAAQERDGDYLYEDTKRKWGPWPHDSIRQGFISNDSRQVALLMITPNRSPARNAGEEVREYYITLSGKAGTHYREISSFQFSPDSMHYAYLGKTATGKMAVVLDGKEILGCALATDMEFSPDSHQLAFFASQESESFHNDFYRYQLRARKMVVRKHAKNMAGGERIAFSTDGQHWAYGACEQIPNPRPKPRDDEAMERHGLTHDDRDALPWFPTLNTGLVISSDDTQKKKMGPTPRFFSGIRIIGFSPDGHLLSIADDGPGDQLYIDNIPVTRFKDTFTSASSPVFIISPALYHLYTVKSEKGPDGKPLFSLIRLEVRLTKQ